MLGDGIVVRSGNPKNIHSYKDIAADPQLRLAYTVGGTGITDNAKALGVRPEQLVAVTDDRSGYTAVQGGRVDGFANPAIILETELRAMANSGLERASPFEQPSVDGKPRYGFASFAVRIDDRDLMNEINLRLSTFKKRPEFGALLEKYGFTKDDHVPSTVTTASLCAG
jgi:polar amino acid transport system substrate-binding protein